MVTNSQIENQNTLGSTDFPQNFFRSKLYITACKIKFSFRVLHELKNEFRQEMDDFFGEAQFIRVVDQPEKSVEEVRVKEERCHSHVRQIPKRTTKVFRTPLLKAKLILQWDSEGVEFMRPEERQEWLDKQGCPWNTFRKWLKDRKK